MRIRIVENLGYAMTTELFETKIVNAPPHWSGDKKKWENWSIKVRGYLGGVNPILLKMIRICEQFPRPILTHDGWNETQIKLDHPLDSILTSLTDGEALEVVETTDEDFGLEVWRQFYKDNEPKSVGHCRTRMMSVIDPKLPNGNFETKMRRWNKIRKDYRTGGGQEIGEHVLMGVVQCKHRKQSANIY